MMDSLFSLMTISIVTLIGVAYTAEVIYSWFRKEKAEEPSVYTEESWKKAA